MGAAGSAQWSSLPPGPRWPQTARLAAWPLRPLEPVEHLRDRLGTPFALRSPAIDERPDRFEPERCLGRRINPYVWCPFGGGVRGCVGMAFAILEMRVVLATLVQRHRSRRAPGAGHRPVRRCPRRWSVTMAPAKGTQIAVERR